MAAKAGVSKALVLYHFRDRASLLAALVDDVGAAVLARARQAAAAGGKEKPLDDHWAWLERELHAGDLRILVSLAECDVAGARAASQRIAEDRRQIAATQVDQIFSRLGLTPRLPAGLIAETVMAFVDGLACRSALDAVRDPRGAFDVLWLALLTVCE